MNRIGVLTLLLILASAASAQNVTLRYWDSDGDPVANITVTLNSTGVSNMTDVNGIVVFLNVSGDVVFTSQYPSSQYQAAIENLTVKSTVNLDDYVTASLRLRNTLGQNLEGQDCSVYVTDTAGIVVHRYETECVQGAIYIDSGGNLAAPTYCPRTDSRGIYTFKGSVLEEDGFDYGRNYTLIIDCNGIQTTGDFYVTTPRPFDVSRRLVDVRLNAGVYLALFVAALGVLAFAAVLIAVLSSSWRR